MKFEKIFNIIPLNSATCSLTFLFWNKWSQLTWSSDFLIEWVSYGGGYSVNRFNSIFAVHMVEDIQWIDLIYSR